MTEIVIRRTRKELSEEVIEEVIKLAPSLYPDQIAAQCGMAEITVRRILPRVTIGKLRDVRLVPHLSHIATEQGASQ